MIALQRHLLPFFSRFSVPQVGVLTQTTQIAAKREKAGSDCATSRAVVSKAVKAKKTFAAAV